MLKHLDDAATQLDRSEDDILLFGEDITNCDSLISLTQELEDFIDEGDRLEFSEAEDLKSFDRHFNLSGTAMYAASETSRATSSLFPPISPCSSPAPTFSHVAGGQTSEIRVKIEKDDPSKSESLIATATCFIDESLTSLDWLIELDINQLTSGPQTTYPSRRCGLSGSFDDWDGADNCPYCPDSQDVGQKRGVRGLMRKPPYSYPELIFMAMQDAPDKQITVAGIYNWIKEKFPYYRDHSNKTWQNSVRHCLSLNSSFERVNGSKEQSGKGAWKLCPEFLASKRWKLEDMQSKNNKFLSERGGRFTGSAVFRRDFHHPYLPAKSPQSCRPLTVKKEHKLKPFGGRSSSGSSSLLAAPNSFSFKQPTFYSVGGSGDSCGNNNNNSDVYNSNNNIFFSSSVNNNRSGSVSSSPVSSPADDVCVFDGVVDSFDADFCHGSSSFVVANGNEYDDDDDDEDHKLLAEFLAVDPNHLDDGSIYLNDCSQLQQQHDEDHLSRHRNDVADESNFFSDFPDHHHHNSRSNLGHGSNNNGRQDNELATIMSYSDCCSSLLGDDPTIPGLNLSLGHSIAPMPTPSSSTTTSSSSSSSSATPLDDTHHQPFIFDVPSSSHPSLTSTTWFDDVESCVLDDGFDSSCLTNL